MTYPVYDHPRSQGLYQSRTQSMPVRRLGAGHDLETERNTGYPILDIRLVVRILTLKPQH